MQLVEKFQKCQIGQLFELYESNNSEVMTWSSIFVYDDFGGPLDKFLCKFLAANSSMGGFATVLFPASQLQEYRPDDFHFLLHLNKVSNHNPNFWSIFLLFKCPLRLF